MCFSYGGPDFLGGYIFCLFWDIKLKFFYELPTGHFISWVWFYRNISTPCFINCPGILWDSTMEWKIHVQSPCLICFCLCPLEAQKFSFVAKICARQCYEAGSLYMYFLLRDSISQYFRLEVDYFVSTKSRIKSNYNRFFKVGTSLWLWCIMQWATYHR